MEVEDRLKPVEAPNHSLQSKVMSGALLGPTGYEATKDNVVSLQMSPDFVGSPFYPNDGPGPWQACDTPVLLREVY